MHAVGNVLSTAARMFCNGCASVAQRFQLQINAKSRGFRRKVCAKSARIARKMCATRRSTLPGSVPRRKKHFPWCCASLAPHARVSRSKTLPKFTENRTVFVENCAHFSLCNAPLGHKKHSDRCKPSAASSRWPRACFAIVARARRSDFASKSTQNRAVFAEKSAQNRRGFNARKTCATRR